MKIFITIVGLIVLSWCIYEYTITKDLIWIASGMLGSVFAFDHKLYSYRKQLKAYDLSRRFKAS